MVTGSWTPVKPKGVKRWQQELVFATQENRDLISWMKDTEVFRFVPRKYSIHRRVVSRCDSVQRFPLLDLMYDFLARIGSSLGGNSRDEQLFADGQSTRC